MNKKKLTIISVALIMIMAVGGVLAYLTSTASVTNTFTVGDVDITLDEAKVNPDGTPVDPAERTDKGNEYHLIPGQTYVKDPTVTVMAGSEESYVRMMVTINCLAELDEIFDPYAGSVITTIFNDYDDKTWIYAGETRNGDNTITYEFRYKNTVSGLDADGNKLAEDVALEPLFKSITIPGTITDEELAKIMNLEIVVSGHAIQAIGFEADAANGLTAEDAAWAAFDVQEAK